MLCPQFSKRGLSFRNIKNLPIVMLSLVWNALHSPHPTLQLSKLLLNLQEIRQKHHLFQPVFSAIPIAALLSPRAELDTTTLYTIYSCLPLSHYNYKHIITINNKLICVLQSSKDRE